MVNYLPGTEEKDPKKIIMALQQLSGIVSDVQSALDANTLIPKAFGYISQSGGTYSLGNSAGISSINKIGTGVIDITLETAMSGTNYAVILTLNEVNNQWQIMEALGSRTSSNIRVDIRNGATAANGNSGFSVLVMGS